VKHLRDRGAKVTSVTDSRAGDDKVQAGGRVHDLTGRAGIDGFVGTLGLPAEQSAKIADAIESAGPDARDELAGIAQVWARGEKGESVPSRMVLSGHHAGSQIWGDDNGVLSWTSLRKLTDAMPKAAAQVEDLHLAACYSGGDHAESRYKGMFPNAKTVWAYSGSAPGTWSGAFSHLSAWEGATRGRETGIAKAADGLVRRGVRKADSIDARGPGEARVSVPLADLEARARTAEAAFEPHFKGEQTVTDSQRGPLRDYYNSLQNLLQHPGLADDRRAQLEGRRDQTLRTLFYDSHIKGRFQATHGAQVAEGYRALGLAPPDFSRLSRADAMTAIGTFEAKLAETGAPPASAAAAHQLLNGLWNLDPRIIPSNWI
jgi:hypothetical protein